MEPIELPVLFISDSAMGLHMLGIESDEEEKKIVCFFKIDLMCPIIHKDKHCTEIFVGGERFICPILYEKLKTMIKFR